MKQAKGWIRIARCNEIPLREGRAVKIGSREIAIFNLGERFLAVENRCPHRGGPLADGIISGNFVVCPLHAWKFSLETGEGVRNANASSCVRTFPTKVEAGIVSLELSKDSQNADEPDAQDLSGICIEQNQIITLSDRPLGG